MANDSLIRIFVSSYLELEFLILSLHIQEHKILTIECIYYTIHAFKTEKIEDYLKNIIRENANIFLFIYFSFFKEM